MTRTIRVRTTITVTVDLDAYAAEYGLPQADAAVDARGYIPGVIREAARSAFRHIEPAVLVDDGGEVPA